MASYDRQGVAEQCLRAQDELQVDVNMLLYASWLASIDQRLSFAHLEGLDEMVREWRQRVVRPLRELRRQLRGYAEAEPVRESVRTLELQSEQRQQDMMWRYYLLAPALVVSRRPLAENLALLFESMDCAREDWQPRLSALVAVLRAT